MAERRISAAHPLARWLALVCGLVLVLTVVQPLPGHAAAAPVPTAGPGAGPVDRPLPAGARPDTPFPPDKRPPVVPPAVRAGTTPAKLAAERWAQVSRRTAPAAEDVFVDLLLNPGFVLGDTSLVAYFDIRDENAPFTRWKVSLYDAESGTEQTSTTLDRAELGNAVCGTPRKFCRSFGAADGWVLDPAKEYFITITAIFADGDEVPSQPSDRAKPRATIVPPAIPAGQAAGCNCPNALGLTAASQAVRAHGVNTGTGAFTLSEQDLAMASFGVQFASTRTYSSINPASGPLGPGWAWSYGMRVTAAAEGAVVRSEDGAEALYKLDNGTYVRPAGVRSTLTKAGDGWELRTPNQITYGFDAQGRLISVRNARKVGLTVAYPQTDAEAKEPSGSHVRMTITDASGRVVKVRIEDNLVRQISLPDGRRVSFGYTDSRLTSVEDATGNTWKYAYNAAGQLSDVHTPKKFVQVHNDYGDTGRVVKQKDALGKETVFEWDTGKQEAKTTDPDKVVVFDGYRGNVLVYTQRGNGDTNNHRYDGSLNRALVVNGNQNQHETTFDLAGNPTSRTAPKPFAFNEKTKYDERNNPLEHTDADGQVWKDEYNEFNELVRSTDPEKNTVTYAYDERGLLKSRTDQRGKVTAFEYIEPGKPNSGLVRAAVSAEGRRTEFKYDETGRQKALTDPRGTQPGAEWWRFTTEYGYDAQDRPTFTHEPGKSGASLMKYDSLGRVQSKVSAAGAVVDYEYFDNGLVKSISEPRRKASFSYTDAGRKSAARVHMGHEPDLVTTYGYNAKGLLQRTTTPRGNVPGANPADFTTTYIYDANDNLVRYSRPYPGGRTVVRDIKVDALDRTTERVDELNKTTSFGRGNTGQVTSTKDALGRTTTMGYDRAGRQTSINAPGGGSTKYEYDPAGNKTKAITATGGVTTWEYDGDGLMIATTEPRGNVPGADKELFTTHYEHDPAENPRRTIDPADHTTVYDYDASNRLVAVTDAKNRTTRYTYDDDDLLRTVRNPDAEHHSGATVYDYAPDGTVTSIRDPNGHTTRFDYDRAGRPTLRIDPLGRRTEISYDADSNRTATITLGAHEKLTPAERAKRTVTETYDIVGRRERRALGTEGPVYTWGYDAKDRTTSYGDPAGVREVGYDDEDQIKEVVRKEPGRTENFAYGYDDLGNVTSRAYPDGTRITASYDKDSRVESMTTGESTWRFGYDVGGRRITTTLPAATGLIEKRDFDNVGRLTGIGTTRAPEQPHPDLSRQAVEDGHEKPGVPRDVTAKPGAGLAVVSWKEPKENSSGLSGYIVTASPGGKTVSSTTTDAVVTGLDAGTAYTFTVTAVSKAGNGPASAPSAAVTPLPAPQDPVASFKLDLDEVGNPTRVVTTRGGVSESVAYTYDTVDRLTSACYGAVTCKDKSTGRIDYTYDLVGNRKSQTRSGTAGSDTTYYDYDDADQLRRAVTKDKWNSTVVDYDYDVRGNQTKSGNDRFEYNLDNTLAKATVNNRATSFGYDATGLRLKASGPDSTQRWAWDVNGTLPQIAVDTVENASGQPTEKRAFAYGPDDEPLALLDTATGAHPYTHDWLGGIASMLSPTAQPEWAYDYDPFGNPRAGDTTKQAALNAAPANPLQFAGAYQDSSTGSGNYHLRARTYNPGTGRFTSTDPMPRPGGAISPYVYGDNNPVTMTDPTGMQPEGGDPAANPEPGPSPEDIAKAQQIQGKSLLDVVLEAGGQILMEILGINDIVNCLKGDIGACVSMVLGALPWGKIFKAPKIVAALWKAGKAVVAFFGELKWAKAILSGAERAAEAARAAAAAAAEAARKAAEKAAAIKAAAEAAARKAAEEAAARAKAAAAKAKAATKKGADKGGDAGRVGCNSFVAGTTVLMADGTHRPIEAVQPGETVIAADPGTGTTEARQVTRSIRTDDDKQYVDIDIHGDTTAGQTLTVTDHHKIWSVTHGRWVDAGKIEAGELLRTSAGTYVQVTAVREYQGQQQTYDLTVDGLHTYHVGAFSVLVHNNSCKVPRNAKGQYANRNGQTGRDGAQDERTVLDHLETEGAEVVRGEVHVKVPGMKARKFDGAVKIDGEWYGVETKGRTSPLTPDQRKFDTWLNTPGNTATSSGKNGGLKLVGVFYGWVT